jgi:hypothetical protein
VYVCVIVCVCVCVCACVCVRGGWVGDPALMLDCLSDQVGGGHQ